MLLYVQMEVAVAIEDCVAAVGLIKELTAKWSPPSMFTEVPYAQQKRSCQI